MPQQVAWTEMRRFPLPQAPGFLVPTLLLFLDSPMRRTPTR